MKKLSATVCAVTHAGRIRKENEDNYSLNGKLTSNGDLKKGSAFVQKMIEPFHLAVCDGMGGESYGELASGIAVDVLARGAKDIYESGEDFSFEISKNIEEANEKICNEITARGARMGTTLAAIYAVKGSIICVNIGDTRIYHYSKGMLEQISFDHTHAQSIVDAGGAPSAKIGSIPDAKRLTKHLGVFPEESGLSPNISVINDVDDGDIVVLCSDGLTDMLSDSDIVDIVSKGDSAQDVSGKLIRMALERGGKDNITVMTAFVKAEETAIFAPIAAGLVGDTDADYEEEYRNSYGSKQTDGEDKETSPYANADARAFEKHIDKERLLRIAGIAAVALVLLAMAAYVIKAVLDKHQSNIDATYIASNTVYNFADYTYPPSGNIVETWNVAVTGQMTTEEASSDDGVRTEIYTEIRTERITRAPSREDEEEPYQTEKPQEDVPPEPERTYVVPATDENGDNPQQPETEYTPPVTQPSNQPYTTRTKLNKVDTNTMPNGPF